MITCKELTELCTEFEEGAMSVSDWAKFRFHMAMCPPCQEYVRQMKLTTEVLQQAEPPTLEPEARSALVDMFKAWRAQGQD